MRTPAPVLRDASRLVEWILGRLEADPGPLPRRLCGRALDLLEAVSLALRRGAREDVALADDALGLVRLHLRLAGERGLLDDRQLVFALGMADEVGRQLGGWLRKAPPG